MQVRRFGWWAHGGGAGIGIGSSGSSGSAEQQQQHCERATYHDARHADALPGVLDQHAPAGGLASDEQGESGGERGQGGRPRAGCCSWQGAAAAGTGGTSSTAQRSMHSMPSALSLTLAGRAARATCLRESHTRRARCGPARSAVGHAKQRRMWVPARQATDSSRRGGGQPNRQPAAAHAAPAHLHRGARVRGVLQPLERVQPRHHLVQRYAQAPHVGLRGESV